MNRSFVLSMISLAVVSSPEVLLGDDRLDAPGPGYRHQVERFAPRGMEARPFELQIAPSFGPTAEREIVVPAVFDAADFSRDTLLGSDRLDIPNPLDRVERFAPRETRAPAVQLQIAEPFGPTALEGIVVPLKASAFSSSSATHLSLAPAVFQSIDFSHPIRLFDVPRISGCYRLPGEPLSPMP